MINRGDDEVSFLSNSRLPLSATSTSGEAQQAGRVGLQMTLGTKAPNLCKYRIKSTLCARHILGPWDFVLTLTLDL